MSLAAYGADGNGLQLEKLRLNFSNRFRASSKKLILTAVVCFLSVNYGYIFPLLLKDNDRNDLRHLPLKCRVVWTKKSAKSPRRSRFN